MRVTLLTPELFSAEGGLSRILRSYLKALCELAEPNGEVRLVTLIDPTLDTADLDRYANDRLIDWAACGRSRRQFVQASLAAARDSDLIICGHIGQLPVARLIRLRYPKVQYILIAHGLEVWRRFNLIERWSLRGAHAIWCVSDFTRQQIAKHVSLNPANLRVLPNGLDPFFEIPAKPTDEPLRPPTILSISRLTFSDRYKGIDHLIAALPAIRTAVPGASLRIVGRGDDLPRLQTLAGEHGVTECVQFLGYLSDAEMKRELAGCRIFALPSEREGFGLVYLEAMAHGKPCVGADAGGAPEVISPETGLLAPFGDVAALARACADALTRAWNRAAIQDRARQFSYVQFRDNVRQALSD